MKTMKELAQEALDVQNACNLSGVVHGMSRVMTTLWEHAKEQKQGTDWVNTHPCAILWAHKICHLTKIEHIGMPNIDKAYDWAYEQINQKE